MADEPRRAPPQAAEDAVHNHGSGQAPVPRDLGEILEDLVTECRELGADVHRIADAHEERASVLAKWDRDDVFYTSTRDGDRVPALSAIAAALSDLVTVANITPDDVANLLSGVNLGVDADAMERLVGAVEGLGARRPRSPGVREPRPSTPRPVHQAADELDARLGGDP